MGSILHTLSPIHINKRLNLCIELDCNQQCNIDRFFGYLFVSHPIAVIVECVEPVIVDKIWLHRNMFFSSVYGRFLTMFKRQII